MSESKSEKKSSNKGLIVIIVLLVLALGGLGYLYMEKGDELADKSTELERISFDLEEALRDVRSMESSNDSMDSYIAGRESRLMNMLDSVNNAKEVSDRQVQRWSNEAYSLRRQVRDLQATVDSVNKAYEVLSVEQAQTKMELATEIERNEDLSSQNRELATEVEVGSQLKLTSINAGAFKVYSSGEEDETERARRAERVKACFTIGANSIAEKGEREVVMRVLTPELRVLTADMDSAGTNTFMVQGKELFFSARKSVWYENDAQNVCLSVDREDFEKGTYSVEVYIDGVKAQEARFVLD